MRSLVLYIFGGSNDGTTQTNAVWAYNPKTNAWSSKAAMPSGSKSSGSAFNNTQSFKVAKNKWTTLASMPQAVIAPGSAIYKGVMGNGWSLSFGWPCLRLDLVGVGSHPRQQEDSG